MRFFHPNWDITAPAFMGLLLWQRLLMWSLIWAILLSFTLMMILFVKAKKPRAPLYAFYFLIFISLSTLIVYGRFESTNTAEWGKVILAAAVSCVTVFAMMATGFGIYRGFMLLRSKKTHKHPWKSWLQTSGLAAVSSLGIWYVLSA